MSRRLVRETALQSLFQMDVGQIPVSEAIHNVLEEASPAVDQTYLRKIVTGTYDHLSVIDPLIKKYSVGWELERMPSVDLAVLRMAVYELLFEPDVPPKVVVNEAVELAKSFSTAESGKFVNGILGKVLNDLDQLRSSCIP
ncbi:transcription antitermination factor NusB [Effusibacillus dendaii]|uniref:Transcription antitermination protein NusB n=1 Tax=Effusibacillus dendaii TaxID=2743772 RepID=A0A7I8D7D7_9BACL|nr:transcription antitermination factor NusB [Effusibacillus dendaii]BCJ85917.1 N utilization substance protein B [Effusibacillus dendaii]